MLEISAAKSNLKRIGFAFLLLITISSFVQIIIVAVLHILEIDISINPLINFLIIFVPLYVFAFPIFYLTIRKVQSTPIKQKKMGFGDYIKYFLMSLAIVQVGNYLGLGLSYVLGSLFGLETRNVLIDILLNSNPWLNMVFIVLLAPALEELVFRKILIDRVVKYGERTAVVLSALIFALFHANFYQFFYAFGVGALFAIVYIRYGKLIYPILLHVFINMLGVIVAPFLLSGVDFEALEMISTLNNSGDVDAVLPIIGESIGSIVLVTVYFLAISVLSLIGLALLIDNRKALILDQSSSLLPDNKRISAVYLNSGTVLYVIVCIGLTVLNIFS